MTVNILRSPSKGTVREGAVTVRFVDRVTRERMHDPATGKVIERTTYHGEDGEVEVVDSPGYTAPAA